MSDRLLAVEHLEMGWKRQAPLFSDLSFDLAAGCVLALLGPNGSGKSTLLAILLGQCQPTAGHIFKPTAIGYVPQHFRLPFSYRVIDVVLMGRASALAWYQSPSVRDQQCALEALEQVNIRQLAEVEFARLSGGQQQLVLIARALVTRCNLLLLDEPTSALDLRHQDQTLTLLDHLAKQQGMGIVFTTHQPSHALAIADKVLLLGEHKPLQGPPDEVLTPAILSRLFGLPIDRVCLPEEGGVSRSVLVPRYTRF